MNRDYIKNRLELILEKYKKLGLIHSPLYKDLEQKVLDQAWIDGLVDVLNKTENSEAIFCINKEITKEKNDQRVLEMFSEIDGARGLVKGSIDGKYSKISYLKKNSSIKSPDFFAVRDNEKYAVEIKMLSPQDTDENKFILRIISKINKKAIPQLLSFFSHNRFTEGLIFIWTHELIHLEKINYSALDQMLKQRIKKQTFPLGIYMALYRYGLWDFHL